MLGQWTRTAFILVGLATGFGGLATTGAQAQQLQIGITAGAPSVQVVDHRRDRWRENGPSRWEQDRRGGCDARQALRKADRMGVHRARVVDAGRRTVTVAGRDRGGRTLIRFANARGCPVIGG